MNNPAKITKTCTKCGEVKTLADFSKRSDRPSGRASQCKSCDRARAKKWAEGNLEKRKRYNKKHYAENREEHIAKVQKWRSENEEYLKEYRKQYYSENSERIRERWNDWRVSPEGKLSEYKRRAKHHCREFSLTVEHFRAFWQKPCHYCNTEIETVGLDRIDNDKGYIPGNVVPCCQSCNTRKKQKSYDSWLTEIKGERES